MAAHDSIHFGMKKLTINNWCQPEVPEHFLIKEEDWVFRVMEPQLAAVVPEEVIRMFEVARGSILYGWFFYPLLTLAGEQLHRVQEAAVRERCKLAGIPITEGKTVKHRPRTFSKLITELSARGIIPQDSLPEWEAVRSLRNISSHPEKQSIHTPGSVAGGIAVTVRHINQLFASNPDYFSVLGERVRRATGLGDDVREMPMVVGIDVGGTEKGYHLVAMHGGAVAETKHTRDPNEAAQWCREKGAVFVAVDSPCGWRRDGNRGCREAEEMLSRHGYSSFSTPTREAALTNPFYEWMLNGEQLYQALRAEYPLYSQEDNHASFCFETYPYLAACAYAGRGLQARDKKRDRREIIRAAGIDDQSLRNIDYIDAAICALVACSVSIENATVLGNADEGFIISPPFP